jgi:hypothetical protein
MEFELSKIDAAVEQPDWETRLFPRSSGVSPAITLAGAAVARREAPNGSKIVLRESAAC